MRSRFIRFIQRADVESTQIVNYDIGYHNSLKECESCNEMGEAICGTKTWRKYGEGPTRIVEGQFSDGMKKNFTSEDFRFTMKAGYLYATALKCSESGEYCIVTLGEQDASKQANFHGIIRSIAVLGDGDAPDWSRDEKGLHIKTGFRSAHSVVFKIKVD